MIAFGVLINIAMMGLWCFVISEGRFWRPETGAGALLHLLMYLQLTEVLKDYKKAKKKAEKAKKRPVLYVIGGKDDIRRKRL